MVMFSRWTNFFQSSVVQCWWAHDNYIASVSCFLSSLPVWSSAAIAHLLPASQCSFMLFKLLFPSSNLINKATSLRTDAHCTFPPFHSVNPKDGCCPVIGWLTSCWKGVPNKVSGECICLVWCINVLGFTVRVACGMLNTRERLTVPAQVAAAAWPADGHTGRQTDRQTLVMPFSMCLPCWGASLRPARGERSYFESDPSFRQRLCSCQEPWLKMTDSVVVEGYARLRDGKKVAFTLS